MLAGEILLAAHLGKAAHGPLEFGKQALPAIELGGRGGGRDDQLHAAVVELIDEGDEAPRLIIAQRIHDGNVREDDGLVVARDLDVIVLAARSAAQGLETEPDGAFTLPYDR